MKKIILLVCFAFIIGWAKIMVEIASLGYSTLSIIVGFVLAPILEEFLFRYLPLRYGKKWKCLTELMWLSSYIFAIGHQNAYPFFGWHMCILIQFVFALVAWQLMKHTNYWYAVVFHSSYNLFVTFIMF